MNHWEIQLILINGLISNASFELNEHVKFKYNEI